MTRVYVGPVSLYDLGQVGELDLLTSLDGDLVIPEPVAEEVTEEPATTALERFLDEESVETGVDEDELDAARSVLDVEEGTATASVLAGVLAHADPEDRSAVGVVSEDRRLRTLAEGFGATTTSAFGVVVRATAQDKYLKPSQAKRIVRRMDQHGLHMTGEVRERTVGGVGD